MSNPISSFTMKKSLGTNGERRKNLFCKQEIRWQTGHYSLPVFREGEEELRSEKAEGQR